MQPRKSRLSSGFTLIELLTVIVIIGVLAALLLPSLNSAREKARRVGCASNLRQIGIAILAYSGDYGNHIPTAASNAGPQGAPSMWYTALTNGGYATIKTFVCPDDRGVRQPVAGVPQNPRSYAMVVGGGNTTPTLNYWIGGSRVTCPYLTNTSVAVVGEYYSDTVLPTIEDNGTISPWITSSSDPQTPPSTVTPLTKHVTSGAAMSLPIPPPHFFSGNYLFLDGHVEWVDKLTGASTDPLALQMFPAVPRGFSVTPPCP